MNSLAEALRNCHAEIAAYLYTGYATWDNLTDRAERQERSSQDGFADEQVWTFLVACGYAIAGKQGIARLARVLTGSNQELGASPRIWFEVLPVPPRKREGATHLDLALGNIALRAGTDSGIALDSVDSPWVCFCEMKWYSDISTSVTYDIHRNQLARVIENALCFQESGKYAEEVYVTLVTPSVFRDASVKSRLYRYKFDEYVSDRTCLAEELEASILDENNQLGWLFPSDLTRRIKNLSLLWVTYDELFEHLPDSDIKTELINFWRLYGNYQGRSEP